MYYFYCSLFLIILDLGLTSGWLKLSNF
uniref:NADH dehydrogenase subunit 1 n=1 Tax=Heterorhabditis bacteriophora TaxID=37862 RepID=A0A1I7X0L3_HETBA